MPRWTAFEPYFHSLIGRAGSDECWRWLGNYDGRGYGRVWRDGRRQGAHRVSYELATGTPIGRLLACHHCDNKWCVNPSHIFIGTHKDNMQDWTRKGFNRLANDRTLWSNGKHWKTNEAAKAKLSAAMRQEFASGVRKVLRGAGGRIAGTEVTR